MLMLTGVQRLADTGNTKNKIKGMQCNTKSEISKLFTNSADSTEGFAVELELILLVEAGLLTVGPDDHHISRNVVVGLVTSRDRPHEPHPRPAVLLPGVGAEEVVLPALQSPAQCWRVSR